MQMPAPDQSVLDRRDDICAVLKSIVPADCVIDSRESMRAFDADGLSAYRQLPLAVVLPETVDQIAAVMKWCHKQGVKIVPRGAGTSLSGGALPLEDAVLLGLGKFNRILEIDYNNRIVAGSSGANSAPNRPSRIIIRNRPAFGITMARVRRTNLSANGRVTFASSFSRPISIRWW